MLRNIPTLGTVDVVRDYQQLYPQPELMLEAAQLVRDYKFAEAVKFYQGLAMKYPHDSVIAIKIADAIVKQNDLERALEYIDGYTRSYRAVPFATADDIESARLYGGMDHCLDSWRGGLSSLENHRQKIVDKINKGYVYKPRPRTRKPTASAPAPTDQDDTVHCKKCGHVVMRDFALAGYRCPVCGGSEYDV